MSDKWHLFSSLSSDENDLVPQVVQAVLSIPSTAHIAVRYTTLQLIGELCEWIDKHPQVIGLYFTAYLFQNLFEGIKGNIYTSIAVNSCQKCFLSLFCRGLRFFWSRHHF